MNRYCIVLLYLCVNKYMVAGLLYQDLWIMVMYCVSLKNSVFCCVLPGSLINPLPNYTASPPPPQKKNFLFWLFFPRYLIKPFPKFTGTPPPPPEDRILHSHRHENLKCHFNSISYVITLFARELRNGMNCLFAGYSTMCGKYHIEKI